MEFADGGGGLSAGKTVTLTTEQAQKMEMDAEGSISSIAVRAGASQSPSQDCRARTCSGVVFPSSRAVCRSVPCRCRL